MEVRQIRHFVAVAEAGSFLAAASQLHISQPALSKSVGNLEDSLQVRLLERGARRVTLTTYGERFYDYGKAILAELSHASEELQTMRSLPGGAITIGSLRTVANVILPKVTANFVQRFPGVRLRVVENYNADLIQGLERGEFDFIIGIVEGHLGERGFRYQPLFHDRLSVIARSGHPLTKRTRQMRSTSSSLNVNSFANTPCAKRTSIVADCAVYRCAFTELAAQSRAYRFAFRQPAASASALVQNQ